MVDRGSGLSLHHSSHPCVPSKYIHHLLIPIDFAPSPDLHMHVIQLTIVQKARQSKFGLLRGFQARRMLSWKIP